MIAYIKQYPWQVGGGAVVLATLVGVLIWQPWKKKKTPSFNSGLNTSAARKPAPQGFCKHRDYPLRHGSCHTDVKLLQKVLVLLGEDLGSFGPGKDGIDGQYGNVTEKAVQKRFKKKSLTQAEMTRMKSMYQQYKG